MKKIFLFLVFAFAFKASNAQTKVPVKITCAPDDIVIRNLYSDTINNNLYVFYLYGPSYKESHYEFAKYDGKVWSVILKVKPMKQEQPQIQQMCVVGNTLYFIANFRELEDGTKFGEYQKLATFTWAGGIFKLENGNLSTLPVTDAKYDTPVQLINFNNSLYVEVGGINRTNYFYKWNGNSWEIPCAPMKDWFKYPCLAVFDNNIYAIINKFPSSALVKFDGSNWTEVELPIEKASPRKVIAVNNRLFIDCWIKNRDGIYMYDGKDFTPVIDENTERRAFPNFSSIDITYDWGKMLTINYFKDNFFLSTALGIKIGDEFYSLVKFDKKRVVSSGFIPTKKVKREKDFPGIHTALYNGKLYVAITEFCAPYFPDGDYKTSNDDFFYYEF